MDFGNSANFLMASDTPELIGAVDLLSRMEWYPNDGFSHNLPDSTSSDLTSPISTAFDSTASNSTYPCQKPEVCPFRNPKFLGRGAQAVIWDVDSEDGSFALKLGNPENRLDDQNYEIHALAMLNEALKDHPAYNHIPRYYGWVHKQVDIADGLRGPYVGYVTEKLDGNVGDYVEALSKSFFSFEEKELILWSMMFQLAVVLDAIHHGPDIEDWKPLSHRDIISLNIFYKILPSTIFPRIVLGDWGDACYETELPPSNAIQAKYAIGIPGHRGPNLKASNSELDMIRFRFFLRHWSRELGFVHEDKSPFKFRSALVDFGDMLRTKLGENERGGRVTVKSLPTSRDVLQWIKQVWKEEAPHQYGNSAAATELQQMILRR
ncbi:hypothetical protein BT63DRAFT_326012 [Microthyrium microscopicum]|uniref:Protein kinase domain-containing protein n=1 Tax=Microthyrium microscopicum TaxID=703497 RepID=A0A6A6U7R2_9PEZI|nr:hypothetical protein BT63DRAFT_326012 [Microthyrium microscopicum]